MTRKWLHPIVLILMVVLLSLGLVAGPKAPPAQADGGAYTLVYRAADPTEILLAGPIPYPGQVTMPAPGRDNGDDLIPGAERDTGLTTLSPRDMALCQVVPFEIEIIVAGDTSGDEPITFLASWGTLTTNNSDFGYDETYGDADNHGVYAAFVDYGDNVNVDPGEDAAVASYTSEVVVDEIVGTFNIEGLDNGDVVVVEVWMVLDCTLPPTVNGNVQSQLVDAYTSTGDAINTGADTVPLLRAGQFTAAEVDLEVVKDDDDIWKLIDQSFQYTLTVSYPQTGYLDIANEVVMTDTLDPWLQYMNTLTIDPPSPERSCDWADDAIVDGLGGTVTCGLGAMYPGEAVTITFWVKAVTGVPLDSMCEDENDDISCSDCPDPDVCNVVEVTTVSEDQDLTNNLDDEPKDIVSPNAVELLSFTARGLSGAIQLDWVTGSEVNNLGFNLYRAPSLAGVRTKLNGELIPAESGSAYGAVYQYIDMTVPGMSAYYYWLEDVDMFGNIELHGPVSAKKLK